METYYRRKHCVHSIWAIPLAENTVYTAFGPFRSPKTLCTQHLGHAARRKHSVHSIWAIPVTEGWFFATPFGGVKNAENGLKMCVWAVMLAPLLGDGGLKRVFSLSPSGPNMGAMTFTETLPNAIYFATFWLVGCSGGIFSGRPSSGKW